MSLRKLKAYNISKGAGRFVRELSTSCVNSSEDRLTKELKSLNFNSRENNIEKVNSNVSSLLNSPQFWMHCYESIKSNPGIHAAGGSPANSVNSTIDGISLDYFSTLAKSVQSGRFRFGPTRKTEITKPGGGSRPSGIADSRDKIVQKGMAVILEQVADYQFYDSSFGSRRGRSAHDAMSYIRKKVPSGMWAIEGDICKCFDNFDHKRLVSLIRKKYISLQTFTDLLYKALKVKIISINSSHINKIGTPQGSVVSPILSNIYLHELDIFIHDDPSLTKYRSGKSSPVNPKFVKFIELKKYELDEAERVRISKGKRKYWSFLHKLRVNKLKEAAKLKIPRLLPKGPNRKIAYVRYVDDFIVFVWGTKNDCIEIKKLVGNFLKSHLALDLSKEKTKITYLKKNKAKFLGFELWQSPGRLISTKKDINPVGKLDKEGSLLKYRGAVMSVPSLRITFSMNSVLVKCVDLGMVRYKAGKFFPTSYKPALQYDIANITTYLKAVFRGLANYYGYCHNWYDAKTLYNYFGRYCVAMTIAHKTKSKAPAVFKKYGFNLEVTNAKGKIISSYGTLSNAVIKHVRKVLKKKSLKSFNAYPRGHEVS